MVRKFLFSLFAGALVGGAIGGCGSEDESSVPFAPELSYSVIIDAEQNISSNLLIRVNEESPSVQVYGSDGIFKELAISATELSVLLAKFSDGAVITDYTDIDATSDIGLPGPDCSSAPKVCQAIEIAHNHASGSLDALDSGPHTGDERRIFIANTPVNLLPETAELILSLERLRIRVYAEGVVVE